jgi:DNA modification methylase
MLWLGSRTQKRLGERSKGMRPRGKHTILVGDCLEQLKKLPDGSAHCCVTSPPYFALRSYLPDGHPDKEKEIGSEPTPEAFLATMVAVFREVRRVLRDDGYMFVNLGDSYSTRGGVGRNRFFDGREDEYGPGNRPANDPRLNMDIPDGNQLLMPHRVALALQGDGWILRDTVIWSKRSPMPQSVNGTRWMRWR